jgi:hypothetical protein
MANSYSISQHTCKQMKKSFSHLLNLALLKHSISLSSCEGKKISYRDFKFALVRNMLAHAGQELQVQILLGGKPQQHW